MKPVQLLKTLLPGLLPLFIFILADEIWGTEIGLYVAVGFGVVQMLVIYLKEKRLDKFVLFDTLLIVVMGLVSIILENDIFFKLKQGIIGIILVLILGISAYSPKNIMLMMSQRYLNGINISGEHQKYMTRSIKILFWLFLIHTYLVFYSAFFMTKEAWGFISGVLFYMIFGIFFLAELIKNLIIRNKLRKVNDEYLAHVDEEGNIIGHIGRVQAHNGSKQLHPVIHVHIFNNELKILLQKRSLNKKVQPGKWDTAVGGHVSYREPIEKAIEREAFEELGLKDLKYSFLTKYIWESEIEKEMVFVFVAQIHAIKFIPNEEVDEVKFWSFEEIRGNICNNIFTPNFINEFERIIKNIKFKRENK
jgi:isopentenyl-diphosphate delta-isomerase type 1